MIELFLLTAIVLFATIFIIKQVKLRKGLSSIPGLPTTFGLGNILQLDTTSLGFLPKFDSLLNQYGDVIKVWLGPCRVLVYVKDLEVIKYILTSSKNINKSSNYDLLKSFVGAGLLTSEATTWKIHRKLMEPAFNYKFFDDFVSIFNEKLDILMDIINKHGFETPVSVAKYSHLYSLDSICEAVLGLNMNCQYQDSEYPKALQSTLLLITRRIFSVLKQIDFVYKFTSDSSQFNDNVDIMHKLLKEVLKNCRAAKKQAESVSAEKKISKSIIDILLSDEMQASLTDQDIEHHINTFFFGGHETVSSTMYFTIYEIAKSPKLQNRILEEAQSIIGSTDTHVTVNQCQEMKYLELVMKEALRKYPPVTMIERLVEEDRQIGKYFFPKGTEVNIQIYNLHHDPRYFPEPEEFIPERFLERNIPPYSYIPFSMGIRNCIGKRYANLIYKTAISRLVLNYSLSLPKRFELQVGLKGMLSTLNGVPVYFKKR